MLEEKISKRLKVPYVELERNGKTYYLCNNGVIFADKEYLEFADLNAEYERRAKEDKLYDYAYARSTGLLRKKREHKEVQENKQGLSKSHVEIPNNEGVHEESSEANIKKADSLSEQETKSKAVEETSHSDKPERKVAECNRSENLRPTSSGSGDTIRRNMQTSERRDSTAVTEAEERRESKHTAVGFIIALLAFTSLISGYISTLQTATYLYDYVDLVSAWLMSASVTAYNVTAFEVAVLFKQNRRYGLTFLFITLWVTVTVFSMATAVSVFYDRFNFSETEIAEDNRAIDSNKLRLEMLRTKEKDIREAIAFKKQDIEYRQEHDYATTAVRNELVQLEKDLQANLTEQESLLSDTPEVTQEVIKKKERLFAFLGRLCHVDSGVFEFIMSTLSAIFVNLISPMSLVAVAELNKRRRNKHA